MQRTNISFWEDQYERLRATADEEDKAIAEYVREAVDEKMARDEHSGIMLRALDRWKRDLLHDQKMFEMMHDPEGEPVDISQDEENDDG